MAHRVRAYWLILPCAVALGASAGWWLELRPAAAEWGTVSSWVAAIGGLVALTFAGSQLHLVLLQRRQGIADSVAVVLERVGSRAAPRLKAVVLNAGQFGVHNVQVVLVLRERGQWLEKSAAIAPPGGVVVPGTPATLNFTLGRDDFVPACIGVRLAFADVDGHSWTRIHTLDGQRLQ